MLVIMLSAMMFRDGAPVPMLMQKPSNLFTTAIQLFSPILILAYCNPCILIAFRPIVFH